MKVKDFWECLWNDYNFRFFSGYAVLDLLPLYKKMDSKCMHYVPAVNPKAALGMASGSYYNNINGGVLMGADKLYDIFQNLKEFNVKYKVPVVVIVCGEYDKSLKTQITKAGILWNELEDVSGLSKFCKQLLNKEVPGILVIGDGSIE